MLAAAEADFEADIVRARKQRAKVGRRLLRQVEREARQQRVEQAGLMRAQLLALAPPEKGALDSIRFIVVLEMHNGRILDAAVCKTQPIQRKNGRSEFLAELTGEIGLFPGEAAVLVRRTAEMAV